MRNSTQICLKKNLNEKLKATLNSSHHIWPAIQQTHFKVWQGNFSFQSTHILWIVFFLKLFTQKNKKFSKIFLLMCIFKKILIFMCKNVITWQTDLPHIDINKKYNIKKSWKKKQKMEKKQQFWPFTANSFWHPLLYFFFFFVLMLLPRCLYWANCFLWMKHHGYMEVFFFFLFKVKSWNDDQDQGY